MEVEPDQPDGLLSQLIPVAPPPTAATAKAKATTKAKAKPKAKAKSAVVENGITGLFESGGDRTT